MKKLKTIIYIGPPEGFEEVRLVAEEKYTVSHVEATKKELEKKLRECDAFIDASMRVFVSDEMISRSSFIFVNNRNNTNNRVLILLIYSMLLVVYPFEVINNR